MLKINIGLSKKVGEANYGSRGASVNLELEADSALASDSDRLKERIRFLFTLAKASVEEELNGHASNGHSAAPASSNGNGRSNSCQNAPRRATASQVRALHAIAQRQHLDAVNIVQSRYGVDTPDDLSITEASVLIDDLKGQASSNGAGGGR
jgi:hypothetical protein